MSVPENTTASARRDPLGTLAELAVGGPELQEARGQSEFVHSEVIPTELYGANDDDLVALGFKLGPVVDGDPIFRRAELPEGWRKERSDHSMWSYIVDGDGYQRCSIFYKAAFYDRSAHMQLNAVPTTRAQYDAISAYEDSNELEYPGWGDRTIDREGPDAVGSWTEYAVDDDGRRLMNGHMYVRTGRTRRAQFAPDGAFVREDVDNGDGSGTTTITLTVDDSPE